MPRDRAEERPCVYLGNFWGVCGDCADSNSAAAIGITSVRIEMYIPILSAETCDLIVIKRHDGSSITHLMLSISNAHVGNVRPRGYLVDGATGCIPELLL